LRRLSCNSHCIPQRNSIQAVCECRRNSWRLWRRLVATWLERGLKLRCRWV
jgi:hypothetical protein